MCKKLSILENYFLIEELERPKQQRSALVGGSAASRHAGRACRHGSLNQLAMQAHLPALLIVEINLFITVKIISNRSAPHYFAMTSIN